MIQTPKPVQPAPNVLTPELDSEFQTFLKSALGQFLAAGSFEIHPLAGDASARRYFRVVAHEESWVLMLWEPFLDDGSYPFLSVRKHFEKHGVQVPQVVALRADKGLVLLEDLGDLTLERKFWENQNQSMSLPYYRQAIDELIKMHYPASADQAHPCTAFKVEFDTAKLLWEMNYGREHLIEGLCQIKLKDPIRAELSKEFTNICERLHREPKFIAHRDYHSRNVMIKLGKVRVIDFQDARMGAIQYDLVSLLRDSYVNLSSEMQTELKNYYLSRRSQVAPQLPQVSRDNFEQIFELQTVQRCFKACGSFASFKMLRGDNRYLKYLPQTLQSVRAALEHFKEYPTLRAILEDHGVFDMSFQDL